MVKHVKLFENWAEENTKLPEYLDPDVHKIDGHKTLYHPEVLDRIKNPPNGVLDLGYRSYHIRSNFESFSDYTIWNDKYSSIYVDSSEVKYKLKDCQGLPLVTDSIIFKSTNIMSLKGLEECKLTGGLALDMSYVENAKYFPQEVPISYLRYTCLLSYYGATSPIGNVLVNTCYRLTYCKYIGKKEDVALDLDFFDPKLNGDVFCHFEPKSIRMFGILLPEISGKDFLNPWINIYEDPNEVENFDFLFTPFYYSSENFRACAKRYIQNLDLDATSLDSKKMW